MLLSRVKRFNIRYKFRYLSGDPALQAHPQAQAQGRAQAKVPRNIHELDPRDSPAFLEVDRLTSSFIASFPPKFRAPVQDGVVDPHLYSALVTAHL